MSTSNGGLERILVLTDSLMVPKWLKDGVIQKILEVAPALESGVEYTLEELCGTAFWEPLSNYHRRLAGMLMVYLVKNHKVPLRFADYSCRSPKRYILKI